MKYEVKVDDQKYIVEAESNFEAKAQAARQHAKKYAKSAYDTIIKSKFEVIKVNETL